MLRLLRMSVTACSASSRPRKPLMKMRVVADVTHVDAFCGERGRAKPQPVAARGGKG